jgi:hypothetical protein
MAELKEMVEGLHLIWDATEQMAEGYANRWRAQWDENARLRGLMW